MGWKEGEDKELKVESAQVEYCTKGVGERELVPEHFLKEVGVEVVEAEVELGSDHFLVEVEVEVAEVVEAEMTSESFLKQVEVEVKVQIEVEAKVREVHFVKELRLVDVNHSEKVVKEKKPA